jgi:Xaa-Pro dipeptidase
MTSVRNPAFSTEEYKSRLSKVQAALAAREIDALLVHNRADICYLTGAENCYMVAYYATVVPAVGEPILLCSEFEMLNAEVGVWFEDRVAFPVTGNPIQATCDVLLQRGYGKSRIGVQPGWLSAERYLAIQHGLPNATLVDAGEIVPDVMAIKSPAEIEYMRAAGRLSTLGMEAAFAEAGSGKNDNDIAAAAYDVMVRGGSEFMCIEPIVTVGTRSGIPHSTFRRTRIEPGDSIFIEVGGCVCRYSAPLMRTVAIAPVPDEVRRAADACRDSLNVLIEYIRPGALARDVAAKAKAAWMPICEELIWHGTYAYSVGIGFPPDWNDAPALIEENSDLVLQPGMCFHTTTSLREPLQYGTAMSETVLITEEGNEILTGTPRELYVA